MDTNILLRHIVDDLPDQSERATALLQSIELGEEQVYTTQVVIHETIFTLKRYYKVSLEDIRDRVIPLINLSGIQLEQKERYDRAFALAIELNIDYQDAFNVVLMREHNVTEVYSWDRHFDRVDGIQRIEPGAPNTNE